MICLLFSAWAALGGGAFAIGSWFSAPPTIDRLDSIRGQVVDAYLKKGTGKGRTQVHVLVNTLDGLHDLARDDLSQAISQVLTVRKHDFVVALVQLGSIAQTADTLWELRRGEAVILRYQDVADQTASENRRVAKTAMYLSGFSVLLFIAAIALRTHFGVWREKTAAAWR